MGRKTLRVRWTHPALADLIEAQAYIARDNPSAAHAVASRVWEAARQLGEHPEIGRADWRSPAEIKAAHRNASFLPGNRVVFNIKGNDYRLVVAVHYNKGRMFIRFAGTHAEYDRIDAETI